MSPLRASAASKSEMESYARSLMPVTVSHGMQSDWQYLVSKMTQRFGVPASEAAKVLSPMYKGKTEKAMSPRRMAGAASPMRATSPRRMAGAGRAASPMRATSPRRMVGAYGMEKPSEAELKRVATTMSWQQGYEHLATKYKGLGTSKAMKMLAPYYQAADERPRMAGAGRATSPRRAMSPRRMAGGCMYHGGRY